MNNDTLIKELRDKGYGYKKIANELDLKVDTVRYACLRMEEESLVGFCKNCGLEMKSVKGKKKKIFCSDKCRWQWWNEQRKGSSHNESI
jgi:orotate phosphoribosyltransferase-like protein